MRTLREHSRSTTPNAGHEISLMGEGLGIYQFQVPKEKQAELIGKGLLQFRTYHPEKHIASVLLMPGYLEGLVKVLIITNPPYDHPCG